MNASDYRAQLQALLPLGDAWTRRPDAVLTRSLAAWAEELARIDARSGRLLSEAMPSDTLEMLADWERVAGLPDACGAELATTIEERRANLIVKLTQQGGASLAWFRRLAETLGYEIGIEEFRPFITGLSRCGDRLWGGHVVRHQWRVKVTGARLTYFRTGLSQCGDLLLKITRAEDLECLLRRLKPAHTHLVFSYEGIP
jgi:uncharacterized protein YmfQ (DUF2313 family)